MLTKCTKFIQYSLGDLINAHKIHKIHSIFIVRSHAVVGTLDI